MKFEHVLGRHFAAYLQNFTQYNLPSPQLQIQVTYENSQQHYIGFLVVFWVMLLPTSASEHPLTDDAKHKHLPPKWTKQKNSWGLVLVISSLQKRGKLSWHHFWVLFDVCDGAPSCWNVNACSWSVPLPLQVPESKSTQSTNLCSFLPLKRQKWGESSMFWIWRPKPWQKRDFDVWKSSQRNQESFLLIL